MELWRHPIIGGAPGTVPLLAVLGAVAWLLGALGAAVTVRRAGCSWTPVVLLVVSGLGLVVFRTHAWPGGPLTFGGLAAAAAWLQGERTAQAKTWNGRPLAEGAAGGPRAPDYSTLSLELP